VQKLIRRTVTVAEGVAAAMLGAMFLTFLLQIFSRYIMVQPFGWMLELCLVLWIWIVFFGCAFVVRDRDHVSFDILYLAVPKGPRKVLALISAAAVAIGMGWSLLPTWDWIDFLKIKKSATLGVPLRTI
jgi:C4-dicarboxylate transporter DctQ subunit